MLAASAEDNKVSPRIVQLHQVDILHKTLDWARQLRHLVRTLRVNWSCWQLRKELRHISPEQYCFTQDYFSPHIPLWHALLGEWAGRPGLRILEVGSFEGRSAVWLAQQLCSGEGALLHCLDLFSPLSEMRFDHNLAVAQVADRVVKLSGPSQYLLPQLAGPYHIVYIDGGHSAPQVLLDAHLCWKLLWPGGILIVDDYLWEPQKPPADRPQLAIDLFLEAIAGQWTLLHRGYQVLVRKKTLA